MARDQRQRVAVDLRNIDEDRLTRDPRAESYQELLRHAGVRSEKRADFVAGPAGPHHRVTAHRIAFHYGESMASRALDPASQEPAARRRKMSTIIGVDTLERKRARFDDAVGVRRLHASSFETQVTTDEAEPATRIVLLHVKHAIHGDRGAGVEARQQTPLALVPKTVTQAAPAAVGPHNEETHETVALAVRNNRASAD